ncbi:MAG: outer membrane lipoprotein carrier protein LolA [Pontiellaceae bacterium]|nr:outer membrane lipoprotein carrier protein LolA [Pontiellaceae bacterium]
MRLEGRLALEASGRLTWRVDTPVQYVLVLKDNAAFQWDEETRKVQQLPFSGNPVFETVITQIQQWFSGQFAALEPDYDVQILSENPPRMAFIPRDGKMVAKAIRTVTVSICTDRRYVEQIVIEDISGDMTSILFHDTVLNEPIDPSAWEAAPREP